MSESDAESQLLEIGTRLAADPRAGRTLKLLTEALLRLLGQEGLEQITVSELCREAGVHRTTFYGHYASVDEFAGDVFARVLDQLATVSPDLAGAESPEQLARLYADTIAALLQHMLSLRSTYRRLVSSAVGPSFRTALALALRRRVEAMLAYWQDHGVATGLDIASTAAYLAGGFTGTLIDWAASDDRDVAARTAAIIALLPPWWPRG